MWAWFFVCFDASFAKPRLVRRLVVEYEFEAYREDLRLAFVLCLSAIYLSVTSIYLIRSARRTAAELAPVLARVGRIAGLEEVGFWDRFKLRTA